MKRYETFLDKHCGQPFANIEEDANGGLVMYDEAQAEIDRLKAENAELLGLLKEARVTFEMWKDVAPAVSLCADIDKAIAKARGGS